MHHVLVVYYTCTGTARRAAQTLAEPHGWQLGEVSDIQPRSQRRCVIDALLRRRPSFRYSGPSLRDFSTVVIVGPIWAGRLAGPLRSFLAEHAAELENVGLITIMRSGGATKAFREAAELLGHAPIACAGFLPQQVDDGSATGRLRALADALEPPAFVIDAALDLAWTPPA